ncbi:MAG: hypothetical protein JWM80_2892 [Cyanobacteria bacterium RYN_339]|nr:hypothetical protein [Cyanobacteria bacterium RYN_339]
MSPADPARQKDLIEASNVPDLERVAMQEMLNALTQRGELSGPPLKEDGKDSETFQLRLRERDARMTIMGSVISPSRPGKPEAFEDARVEDFTTVEVARAELVHLPDEVYNGVNPRAVCVAKVRALGEAFERKWAQGAETIAAIAGFLANPPEPDALLLPTRRIDIAGLEKHLVLLKRAEAALDGFPAEERERPGLADKVMAYQHAIVAGLGGKAPSALPGTSPAPGGGTKAIAPSPPAGEVPAGGGGRPAPPPRKPPPPPVVPLDPEQQAFQEWCTAMTALPEAGRAAALAELEAAGAGPEDTKVGFLASLIALANPAGITPEGSVKLDDGGLRGLAGDPVVAGLSPGVRMAIVKELGQLGGPRGDARGALAGSLAAGLVRQFPKALVEVLQHAQGPNRSALIAYMTKGLEDDEIFGFGREAMHAIYKGIGTPATDEARRQSARLGRLSQRK